MESNPWLDIDISDYVNHMSSSEVGQYALINECFRHLIQKYNSEFIFVPGCTIGNGFEHIDWNKIEKITALDINPEFLNILGNRFPGERKLEIVNTDFLNYNSNKNKYDLIFVALLFEYVSLSSALTKIKNMMKESSILFSIIQLPDENQSKVSKSKYKSLEKLGPYISLITVDEFEKELNESGFCIKWSEQRKLVNGKSFLLAEVVLKKY